MPGWLVPYTDFLKNYGDPTGLPRFALDKLRERASPGPAPDVQAPVQFRMEELNPSRGQLARGLPDVADRLRNPGIDMPTAPTPEDTMAEEMTAARAGFKVNDDDIAAIRAGVPDFLARGNERREAGLANEQRMAQQSVFPGGRTVQDDMRSDIAFRGLQRARDQQDPSYNRRQRHEDAVSQAATFMDPTVKAARGAATESKLGEAAGMKELALRMGLDPRALQLDDREFNQKLQIAEAQASGRGLGGILGMGNSPAPRGTGGGQPASEQEIRAYVLGNGGTENDVLETMSQYKAAGLLR